MYFKGSVAKYICYFHKKGYVNPLSENSKRLYKSMEMMAKIREYSIFNHQEKLSFS